MGDIHPLLYKNTCNQQGPTVYVQHRELYSTLSNNLQSKGGFPGGSDDKESACNAGDLGLIPGLRRSSGQSNGYPQQCSCLENAMDRETWQAI